jgi:hypothetical protein
MTARTCRSCPTAISPRSRTGRCRTCACNDPAVRARKGQLTPEQRARRAEHARSLSRDPAIVAKRAAAAKVTHADAEVKARHRAACAKGAARRLADPVKRERMREIGLTYGAANLAAANTPEARAMARSRIRNAHLAWCPEDLWPLNATLKANGYLLAERKEMVAAEVARRERQRIAALSPLERQLERLRAGARLVTVPVRRRGDPTLTLPNTTGASA